MFQTVSKVGDKDKNLLFINMLLLMEFYLLIFHGLHVSRKNKCFTSKAVKNCNLTKLTVQLIKNTLDIVSPLGSCEANRTLRQPTCAKFKTLWCK